MKNLFKSSFLLLLLFSTKNTIAQVPVLSSNPSASSVIFLDFDGHTVSGTGWNYNGPIYCGASGLDDTKITTIFNRVAEDYRPFNINITTDSTKYWAAPANSRMRVIGTVSYEWYGSAGGVAFVGSYTYGNNTPCFVFTGLLNYNVKNISEAMSHEAGHTLGLYHQSNYDANCVKVSDYHYGVGTGEIGWAPIMGVGYYQNFTLWNNGPNSYGCTNFQSDLDIITTGNGFSYRTDDYDAAFNLANNVPFVNNQFTVNGIIERNTDQDLIKITQPAVGRFQLDAIPYNVGTGNAGSDLDLQVSLYNSAQTLLNIYNPGTLLSSVIDTLLNPGTYYLRVEGKGNMYTSNYASLGSYSLLGQFTAGNILPLRKLQLYGQLNGDKHQLNWLIDADEKVIEQVLEVSTDGRNFNPLVSASENDRSYLYKPNTGTTALYRLSVTFDNGHKYYSNVVTLRTKDGTPRPFLVSNMINSGSIMVKSPGNFEYAIYDLNGKTVGKGQLVNGLNSVSAERITGGMYLIKFANKTEQWSDKFLRQ
jgi:hypothetical protein